MSGSVMGGSAILRSKPEAGDLARLRSALLTWYRRHRRRLPWRETRDPYRIWVSEILLQQTQVATATPYYARFLTRFPSVRALARAPLDDVLAAWAGLGYYRRARHLHAAAKWVVREHAGRVPSEPRAFAALPGVGRYTAGAVLSIGFGAPLAVLDGNVARVLARLTARPLAIRRPADARSLWALAEAWMPRRPGPDPGTWNQALMELGATVCTPRAPRCGRCPVRAHCRALAAGLEQSLPPTPELPPVSRDRRAIALVERRGRTLLVRREGALLQGLWEPPGVELARRESAGEPLLRMLAGLGVRGKPIPTSAKIRHTITRHDITVEVWRCRPEGRLPAAGPRLAWVVPGETRLALTALARRVLDAAVALPPRRAKVRA